jgi:hypothetical protein
MTEVTLKHIHYVARVENHNEVYFEILSMDEKFRASLFMATEFRACNGMRVCSVSHPKLYETGVIFLRGGDCKAYDFAKLKFEDEFHGRKDARRYLRELHLALKDWDRNWPGWKD